MNRSTKIALIALGVWAGYCGWLAYHYHGEDNHNLFAPNQMKRIQEPLPLPISPEAIRQEEAIVAAGKASKSDLRIDGKQIVVSSAGDLSDPERHDAGHAMYRAKRKALVAVAKSQ